MCVMLLAAYPSVAKFHLLFVSNPEQFCLGYEAFTTHLQIGSSTSPLQAAAAFIYNTSSRFRFIIRFKSFDVENEPEDNYGSICANNTATAFGVQNDNEADNDKDTGSSEGNYDAFVDLQQSHSIISTARVWYI